jgi:hypothetical protein
VILGMLRCPDPNGGESCRHIADNRGICSDHRTTANSDVANDARVATDEDMIANRSSARSRSCANRAHMMKSTVGTDLSGTMHADRTAMRSNETRSDFSVGIDVDQSLALCCASCRASSSVAPSAAWRA